MIIVWYIKQIIIDRSHTNRVYSEIVLWYKLDHFKKNIAVIVCFVDIGGIVDHQYLNLFFIINFYPNFVYVCLMVFNATFNNISIISWRSVLFVEETGCLETCH